MRFSLSKRPVFGSVNGWINPSVASGTYEYLDHARFIGLNLVVVGLGLVAAPIPLVFGKEFAASSLLLVSFVVIPMLLLILVSRTAKLELAKTAALLSLSVLVAIIIISTAAQSNFALAAFAIIPVEAVLWRCRKAHFSSLAAVAAGLMLVFVTPNTAILSLAVELPPIWLSMLALIYAISVAWRIQASRDGENERLVNENINLATISQSTTDLITRNCRNGSTLFASPAARALTGVGPKELIGAGLFEKTHLQDRIIFLKAISDAVHTGRNQTCEIRIRYKGVADQLWKKTRIVIRLTSNIETGATEVICTIRDISLESDLKAELEKVSKRSDQFSQSQRQFLAKMSHELRTPLNAVVGFSDVLQQELFGSLPHERHHEYVNLIHESGQHLLCVVNDLLDISRIEAGKYELALSTFDFDSVVASTINMLQPLAAKKSIELTYDVNSGLDEITADRRSCQQILINLVTNAIKFSHHGGKVLIKVKPFGRSFKIQVLDEGVGIASDFLPKIGEPFLQADTGNSREFEGSGLGVSIVKGLVDLHHGEFKIQSTEGAGTTVTVTLPIRTRISKPIPGEAANQLVRLDEAIKEKSDTTKPVTSSVYKGESRARLSA